MRKEKLVTKRVNVRRIEIDIKKMAAHAYNCIDFVHLNLDNFVFFVILGC